MGPISIYFKYLFHFSYYTIVRLTILVLFISLFARFKLNSTALSIEARVGVLNTPCIPLFRRKSFSSKSLRLKPKWKEIDSKNTTHRSITMFTLPNNRGGCSGCTGVHRVMG